MTMPPSSSTGSLPSVKRVGAFDMMYPAGKLRLLKYNNIIIVTRLHTFF